MATQQPPVDTEARRAQVMRDLEAAIAQTVEEIRQLEALLAAKQQAEKLQRTLTSESEE